MLYWAVIFFVIAVVSGAFGFGGIATASAAIAQLLFWLFCVLFVISIVLLLARKADKTVDKISEM